MASQKSIKLYVYVDGVNDVPFFGTTQQASGINQEQIEIGAFKYDAKRMGGTPSVTCTLKYPQSLDSLWSKNIYCLFNNEKFFLRQIPSSSKSNTEDGYSYSLEFVSERDILNNVYMYDAVIGNKVTDNPVSNSTKFSFFGNIQAFAERINSSLQYSKLQTIGADGTVSGYQVKVDEGIDETLLKEERFVSFENTFFSNAIQEIYNTYQIPYYFKGKEIHIGLSEESIDNVFRYGVDYSLLSIKKDNANNKVVNRATGFGSSDNIPYYYPNNSPKGDISAVASEGYTVKILNYERYADKIAVDETITYKDGVARATSIYISDNGNAYNQYTVTPVSISLINQNPVSKWFKVKVVIENSGKCIISAKVAIDGADIRDFSEFAEFVNLYDENMNEIPRTFDKEDGYFNLGWRSAGTYYVVFGMKFPYLGRNQYTVTFTPETSFVTQWEDKDGNAVQLSDIGLSISPYPKAGTTITQKLIRYINPVDNLMPSKYRETEGSERFYEAVNGEYKDKEGNDIIFNNPYVEGRPSENIVEVEDIKPTIKDMLNSLGQRIDMFSEVAYDEPDNDDTSTDSEGNATYQHPHFFAKLRKLPFNLFDCALESGDMTFSITSGSCGACNFKLKVDGEYPYKNTVQVDSEGNLLRDSNGRVLCGLDGYQPKVTPQARQQDTVNNEVWIALEKEEETYGILMPKAPKYNEAGELIEAGYRVKGCTDGQDNGDTFVILNILLPDAYILAAEKKLEQEIIRDMKENNDERFNFSITFSSIFFEEHPEILALLNENSKLKIEYNGEEITQYVSSFSYSMSTGNALPTISVELSDSLTVAQNALKNTIQQVKMSVKESIDNAAQIARTSYISKESNDVANGVVDFRRGVKFGDGGQVEIDENNNTKLIIDFLTVNKKALFKALDIQDAHHIGGEILISPASMLCNKVEELADVYRCYFQDYDDNGNQIFNTFVVNDQAYCKTLNTWGTTYYWRLVVAVGSNYIDLSKSVCDENSDAPREGDKIIQLGYRNANDNSRKSAIKISSYGENTPSFVMYTGIDSFSLEGKEIHGTIYRNNNGEYEAYFYNYGSMLLGDPKKEKDYIEFDAVKGEFEIKANVKFKSSQSLQGITDYENLKNGQDELNEGIINLGNTIQGQIDNLQTQIDGAIETWFYEGVPTLSNTPAVDWTDNDTRNKHLGDLYYDQTTGKCYRFQMDDASNYIWREITDTSIKAALDAANKAQETADGKMKVFVAQPKDSDSYQVGDLWVNATYGSTYSNDLLKCKTAKAKDAAFSISHWEKATKYTDDSEINKYAYLKAQLQETSIEGGLILTSLISLGMNEESGGGMTHTTYSGISGVYDGSKSGGGIAAWYGGDMVDAFDYANAGGVPVVPSNIRAAKSLFRFDGTGYLASGNITWDANGYGQMGGVGDNYALKWDATGVRIGANIKIGAGDETVQMLANLLNMFELDTTSVAGKTLIHAKYDGLYSDGDIAAGGAFAVTPSGGGKTYLNELLDVQLATSSLNVGDILMWNGEKYVNIPQSSITPDLSAYATQQWVLDKKYLTSVPVTSVVGQTGNITTAQVASALTDAGYKLTDTTYGLATTTSNGLMSATDKTKLDGIDANANNYTLPTASSSTKGGIKVGATLSISGEVLDLKSGFPKGTYTKVQIDDYGRVVSGSTLSASDIPNLSWSKITTGKPTTISGYGITDAYTKTETDNKVAALQSLLDSMFERVYDSNNKLIRVHSNVTISSSGDLVAGSNSEGGGTSGGAYTQLEWNAIKALTQSESGLLASAYSVKEAYNELNTAIETLAGKATNVKFTQTLTSGKQIGSISIDGKSTSLFAPANYAWSEITGKPSFATVATSGSYTDLTNKPTIASLMGSTAIGDTSSYLYWNGSAWATKALGSNAFTSISKVSQLTNDSGYITGITKAMVEGVLTGNITSHTHSYLPLSGGTIESTSGYLLTLNRISDSPTLIAFQSRGALKGFLGITNTGIPVYLNESAVSYPLLHSGNYNSYAPKLDGTGATGTWGINISGNAATATNADKLDNIDSTGFLQNYSLNYGDTISNAVDISPTLTAGVAKVHILGVEYSSVLTGYDFKNKAWQLRFRPSYNDGIYFRSQGTGTSWKQIAFTDSNVASATKLQNSRTIWGQSFDGTGNVSGALSGVTNINNVLHINSSGNVTIGNSDLAGTSAKLYVNGDAFFSNDTRLSNWAYLQSYKTDGTRINLIGINNSNCLLINSTDSGVDTAILGNSVGIGTTSPSYKLHVVGAGYYTGNIIASGDVTAGSDIRYKDKIQDLRLSVHDIALAPAFTYKWNNREDDALVHIGSSAQYWLNTNAKDAVYYDKQNDFYHLNYASLALCNTIILARGMETQEEKIARLEERIKELEDKLRQYDSCR